MDIDYSDSVVKWNNGNRDVEYHINGVEDSSEENGLIYIEIYNEGEFEYYYVDKEGKFILSYSDEAEQLVLQNSNGVKKNILVPFIKEVAIDTNKRIFVLVGNNEDSRIYEYTKDGEIIRQLMAPLSYIFYRFSQISDELQVICQGNEDKIDKYGRNDWKFKYNFINNEWEKVSLAY